MEIIAHRGYWETQEEKNTEVAFARAFQNGFGVETDFRDFNSKLVIAHNIPTGDEMSAEDFFRLYSKIGNGLPLALNVKADGLQERFANLLEKYQVENYFLFDMSIPDTLGYVNKNLKIFSRHSEYEKDLPFYQYSDGVWMDCFNSDWFNEEQIISHIGAGKKVCIVSPELHKREIGEVWSKYRVKTDGGLSICTDLPQKAASFFNQSQ